MKRCPNCKAEILFETTEFCEHCGVTLKPTPAGDDDAMDFTVSEAHDSKDDDGSGYSGKPAKDTLGVQSSAQWLEDEADEQPAAPIPVDPAPAAHAAEAETADAQQIRKLSDKEVQSIEKKLYNNGSYLSENEKQALLKKMGTTPSKPVDGAPVKPVEMVKPVLPKRGRGLAYFLNNYIQIHGEVDLHENDEIIINDRPYLLRKKHFTTKTYAIAASIGFLLLLMVLVPMLVRDTHDGQGEIVGVALDDNHQPFIGGAVIRLPESGKTVTANGEGFFRIDKLDPGTHRVEYVVDGQTIKVDYATVTAGDLTTMTLFPGELASAEDLPSVSSTPSGDYNQAYDDSRPVTPSKVESIQKNGSSGRSGESGVGKVELAANVDGAKLSIDGTVIGAGNLTFSRIKSGQRKYTVTKDGYQTASGVINVPSDATVTIEVALNPTVETRTTLTVKDMYDQSVAKMKAGDVENAIAGFTTLLDQQPQYTPAYMARAEAYTLASRRIDAHDDYLRAAEILRINGDYGQAMTGFNNAIKVVPTSVPALLGRAGLHMARQEEIAAIADYEAILQVDKRSAQANFGLGEARFAQGNYKQAIKHFKDARSDDPGNALIYQYLMLCYFGDDDLKNVKKSYDKFKEMATQDEVQKLHQDKAYTAVLRVVQNEQ